MIIEEFINEIFSDENKEQSKRNLADKGKLNMLLSAYDEFKNEDLYALKILVQDWIFKRYREIPLDSIAVAATALFYKLIPTDFINDKIPVIGEVDDALVISFAFKTIKEDLDKYKEWRRTLNISTLELLTSKFEQSVRLELVEVVELKFSEYRFDVRDKLTREILLFSQQGKKLYCSYQMHNIHLLTSPDMFTSMYGLLRNEIAYMDLIYSKATDSVTPNEDSDDLNNNI